MKDKKNIISALLTRKRLQLKDITPIITKVKYHLFIIFIKNVENLQVKKNRIHELIVLKSIILKIKTNVCRV